MNTATADLCDERELEILAGDVVILSGNWQWFGQTRSFAGPVSTVEAAGCNHEIRRALAEPGNGRVLLVDAQGDMGACVGENLALLALQNEWAGVIVHGNVRDAAQLKTIPLGIVALGVWPARSQNKEGGCRDVPLFLGNKRISPGNSVCADEDGVVILLHR